MNILWFSWKDISHPQAGGAEIILHELSKRLVTDGHSVTILTARYQGSEMHDTIDGIKIIRVGNNRYAHSAAALWYYLRNLRNRFDVVVEAVNTAPYFSCFFKGKAKSILFYHQLAREIWFHEAPAPLSHLGYYVLEPIATFLMGKARATTVTISNSTKQDLLRFGFKPERIAIISEGIEIAPIKKLSDIQKYSQPTMLSLGSVRAMKQTQDQVEAFALAKQKVPELRLIVAGDHSGAYGQQVLDQIEKSRFKDHITVLGRVSLEKKIELMQKSHFIAVTSIKEGWGLIVTEAASQGTPAVVYDVDGLRDSVKNGVTGIVTRPTPKTLADGVVALLADKQKYQEVQENAWRWSKEITFAKSYKDFMGVIENGK
ncbi:MAG TPA: glycosyltransferase family 4 protein [Candidatus Saccharimonadales bacterium]